MEKLGSEGILKSHEVNYGPTLLKSQENINMNRVDDLKNCCGDSNFDNDSQKTNILPAKRIRRQPSKLSKDF
jgi:hypothetical protein